MSKRTIVSAGLLLVLSLLLLMGTPATAQPLEAGDANQDYLFSQEDIMMVLGAGKYLTGQPATWSEGDWDGAPGGTAGFPPPGDGDFDQFDLVAAQIVGWYTPGAPYYSARSLLSGGILGDSQLSVVYDAMTGEFGVDVPTGMELTSFQLISSSGIFTSDPALNVSRAFDVDSDEQIFKATFASSFTSLSFGPVAASGWTEEFLLADLSVSGTYATGGLLEKVDLAYDGLVTVPAPGAILLGTLGAGLVGWLRRRRAL